MKLFRRALPLAALIVLVVLAFAWPMMAGVNGALFTTTKDGTVVNENTHYAAKGDVYLTGGPQNSSAFGLSPDGIYYFQITDPSGKVLLSTDDVTCRQVVVSGGKVIGVPTVAPPVTCTTGYHALGEFNTTNGEQSIQAGCDGTSCTASDSGYLDTPNLGGEYKMWLTPVENYNERCAAIHNSHGFCDADSKTDNFKLMKPGAPNAARLRVCKYQDLNLDGVWDTNEPALQGWHFTIQGTIVTGGSQPLVTGADGCATFEVTDFGEGGTTTGTLKLSEEEMAPGPPPFVLQYAPTPVNPCVDPTTSDTIADCSVVGSVTSAGAPVAPGTVAGEGSAWVSISLSPGEDVTVPYFGNQCFSDNNYTGFANGSCAHMPVTKTAESAITYGWTIKKTADPTSVKSSDGSSTYDYTVTVGYAETAWQLHGDITVTNETGVDLPAVSVTDDAGVAGSTCLVEDPNDSNTLKPSVTIAILNGQATTLHYQCDFTSNPGSGTNTGTATFNSEVGPVASIGTAPFDFSHPTRLIDDSVTVSDPLDPNSPHTIKVGDDNPTTITYSATYTGDPAGTCTQHVNTATLTTDDTGTAIPDSATVITCVGKNLSVGKTTNTSFTRRYNWGITKSVNPNGTVEQAGSKATLNYTVTASELGFTDSGWTVSGTITVSNPNDWEDFTGVTLSDSLAGCTITGWTGTVLRSASASATYSCPVASAASGENTATASWSGFYTPGTSATSLAVPFSFAATTATVVDKTVSVTDTYKGALLPSLTATDAPPYTTYTWTYPRGVTISPATCSKFDNTATVLTTTPPAQPSASASVTVCNTITGALTMGFWQNKNGQAIINANQTALAGFLSGFMPFADLSTSGKSVAQYVTAVIKAANAGNATMNAMLKAQMLATALDVFFGNGPGGNPIGAPVVIGNAKIDLTRIWGHEDTTAAFGGAQSMTVSQILAYASSQCVVPGGMSGWYGQVRVLQGLAKDTFDSINNQTAGIAP